MIDLMDLHTHTLACGHAYNTLYEMARSASEKGVPLFGSSDHAPAMPGSCHKYYFTNFRVIPRTLFGMPLLMGAELNITDFDGQVDLPQDILRKMDYVIASLHVPCITPGTARENTDALIGAMKNPYVKIIGHPDDDRYPLEYERLIPAALEYGVALEVNNSSFNPRSGRQNAAKNVARWLEIARAHRLPIILGSDAHIYYDVGDVSMAEKMIKEANYPEELVLNASLEGLNYILNRR